MTETLFPQRRNDGTFTVAVRYAVPDVASLPAMREALDGWLQQKTGGHDRTLLSEFATRPHLDSVDAGTVQVVLDCLASAALWKGFMIEITKTLDDSPGVTRLGFWDLVSGQPHPASS
ncbi:hypothetical protein [Kutzneria sp. NPDC052558]|uniref:hypothetical protein n=1 Tax=Kutzneria sp. NPDC052558 TaxID=3364121 RepID=UPI0037C7BF81